MAFGNEVKTGNITENWLFTLPNRQGGNLYLSFKDTTVSSTFYYGVILNKPSIRESIDLKNSTAKTSNISITIADFNYNGESISKELYGGSNQYINQEVVVKSQVNGATPRQIGAFRLTEISTDGDKITLSLSSRKPWDFISTPTVKSPLGNTFPISYGDYTANASTVSSPDFCESKSLFPAPLEKVENDDFIALNVKNATDGKLHFYDKSADIFVPLDDVNNNSVALGNGFANVTDIDLHRKYKVRPNSIIENADYSDYSDNGANTIDTDENSSSDLDYSISDGTLSNSNRTWNLAKTFNANVPQVQHEVQEYKTGFTFEFTLDATMIGVTGDTVSIGVDISDKTSGSYSEVVQFDYTASFLDTGQFNLSGSEIAISGDFSGSGVITESKTTQLSGDFKSNIKGLTTDTISYQVSVLIQMPSSSTRQITAVDFDFKMYETFIQPECKIPVRSTDEAKHNSASESIAKIETLYAGNDGLTKTYSGASGVVTKIHEAHREILNTFSGVDASDANILTNFSGEDWSDFNTAKTNWLIRYWRLESISLKDILEKLQYEGGFIFKFTSTNKLKYIYLKQSMTATTTFTKQDIANVSVSPSSFSDLITKMNINYQKHPAIEENRYISTVTSSNNTIRTNYNIQSEENILEVNLDAYVAPTMSASTSGGNANPNNDFYSYYDNILGDIKLIVQFNLVNPEYYNIDVGEIIDFSDMYPETPFGHNSGNWSGLKFIVTDINRTCGSIKIKAREV